MKKYLIAIWLVLAVLNIALGVHSGEAYNVIIGAWLIVISVEQASPRARRVLNRPIGRRR